MDRASIERELRNAEAALSSARDAALEAADAVEERYKAVVGDGGDLGSDADLSRLVSDKRAKTDAVNDATQRRDNLMSLLAANPIGGEIAFAGGPGAEEFGRDFSSLLKAQPWFGAVQAMAEGGSAIGALPGFEAQTRKGLIRSLRSGMSGFMAVGEGATGESLIAIDQRLFPPVEIPVRQVRLLDLITIGATDSNLVRYGKQTVRTDAVAPEDLGAAFPNATYTWTYADANVRNIGQYVKAPRETLLDIPALQTLIEQQLGYGVLLETESLVYSGNGVGDNFEGITVAAASNSIVRDTTNERRSGAINRAMANIRNRYYEPDAVVMNPLDFHAMLVEESTSGGFLLVNSRTPAETNNVWGLPIVVTPLATSGTVLVGQFKLGATMWVRSGVELAMSDSNEDDFLKRLIAFRAEFRAAFAAQRPDCFELVTAMA